MTYLSLFLLSLVSATLFPGGSEVLLATLVQQQYNLWWLWLVASLGNTLGSVVNYGLGRYLIHFQNRRWFPFKAQQVSKSQLWFARYGKWSLLFAWLPIIGDPLTFYAGLMKTRFPIFLALVWIGKSIRYALVIGLATLV
ncbi:MAG: YqaA family protein [Hydrogenovibrio sp.]|nr:YqaA family protein [Hydrogenovibrio sp.]